MLSPESFDKINAANSFLKIFDSKGEIGPIAQKAFRNLELKMQNSANLEGRIHYFAIGHKFKQLDVKQIFRYAFNEAKKKEVPTRFLSLQSEQFDKQFFDELKELIEHIRNINSHYVHSFERIRVDRCKSVIGFLRESFQLALIMTYLDQNKMSYQTFIDDKQSNKNLIEFLSENFKDLASRENKKDFLDTFKNLKTAEEAIDKILFVKVFTDFQYPSDGFPWDFDLNSGEHVSILGSVEYLSFYACLFLLSMFLYKNEANQLISEIKGFKDSKRSGKRDIFTFFSKKFSSQDIDGEEPALVKFRDIIQYLSHYPVAWNSDMELQSKHPEMTDRLKDKLTELEINRSFFNKDRYDQQIEQLDIERFYIYAKYQLWGKEQLGTKIKNFNSAEIEKYKSVIEESSELKDIKKKIKELSEKHNLKYSKTIEDLRKKEKNIESQPNDFLEKFKEKIHKNLIFTTYARNQDHFMDYALKYLAEVNYFGADAEFKMYKYFSMEEQERDQTLRYKKPGGGEFKSPKAKKESDNLKYHQGREVDFFNYAMNTSTNIFVIENNAIQVKLTLLRDSNNEKIEKIVSIQRGLMVYFLEDAMFRTQEGNMEGSGKKLLSEYYFQDYLRDFSRYKSILEQGGRDSDCIDKKEFIKLLPKRLVYRYSPAVQNYTDRPKTILDIADVAENRYKELLDKAEQDGRLDDFIKHNKGKQFKLQFIRKAWNLMYFKDCYTKQLRRSKEHHKSYHITRDEFDLFCRFMYAFDEDSDKYRERLKKLFEPKHFFDNKQFNDLFFSCRTLDDFYEKTKRAFEIWNPEPHKKKDKYSYAGYKSFFEDKMFYINISHFVAFLNNKWNINEEIIRFKALENVQYLIPEYYYKDKLEKPEYKTSRKLFNELKSVKREDALLYEMAFKYLSMTVDVNNVKKNVENILNQDIVLKVKDCQGKYLYELNIPFKKIDDYENILIHKKEQEDNKYNKGTSFMSNLDLYIKMVRNEENNKALKETCENYIKNRTLTFADFQKINNHLLTTSNKFTRVSMALEKYYILKTRSWNRGEIDRKSGCYYVDFNEIVELKPYFIISDHEERNNFRNKALHFAIPEKHSYMTQIQVMETKFIEEVKRNLPNSDQLNRLIKNVCRVFFDVLTKKDNNHYDKDQRNQAMQEFFKKVISTEFPVNCSGN